MSLSMQRKTLLGLNLSYDISKNFNIGGTIMHYYEKPLTTKTEIGNESVKNTLWGTKHLIPNRIDVAYQPD